MLRIRFEPSGREIAVTGPAALMDIVDELPGTRVQLSCRSAHCGACRVRVEGGAAGVEPAAVEERATLAGMGLPADERLACQLRVRADAAETLVLRVTG